MDLKYYSDYDEKIGFKVAVDGLHNLDKNSIFIAIYCIFPDGALYSEDFDPLKIHINSNINWNSPKGSIKFNEGYSVFKNIPFSKNSCIIIDIRKVVINKNKMSF